MWSWLAGLGVSFWLGLIGGALVNLVRLAELYNVPKIDRPSTFGDPFFYVQFFALPLIGGIVAWAYQNSGTALTPILALNIGASAPAIIKSFASAIPKKLGGSVD